MSIDNIKKEEKVWTCNVCKKTQLIPPKWKIGDDTERVADMLHTFLKKHEHPEIKPEVNSEQ